MGKSTIYTRTGDKGQTSLYSGKRVSKDSQRIHVVGELDELNSHLGIIVCLLIDGLSTKVLDHLTKIQCTLFSLGAHIATPRDEASETKVAQTTFDVNFVTELEQWIDELDEENEPLRSFILPGGHPIACQLHLARTVCRRCERNMVGIEETAFKYINRLSDYLFVAARWINSQHQVVETKWKSMCPLSSD